MQVQLVVASLIALAVGLAPAQTTHGDSKRGSRLFESLQCSGCHRAGGVGATTAPDLGKVIDRGYTPSSMASRMWNHAPVMWSSMTQQGMAIPVVTESQASDLFAYFHSLRFFEQLGDAGRGKRVFMASHCNDCHNQSARSASGAPPIAEWKSLASPIALAQSMWNHADLMELMMANRKLQWPRLTSQEFTDLLVYVRNLPQTRGRAIDFSLPSAGKGAQLLEQKGCLECHQGKLALHSRLQSGTLTDFTVALWNHAPQMAELGRRTRKPLAKLDSEEMGAIVSYLWNDSLYTEAGDVSSGQRVFEKKNCASCHSGRGNGAPELKQRLAGHKDPIRPFTMTAVLWQHGPTMNAQLKSKDQQWPTITGMEMANLISYLNSLR